MSLSGGEFSSFWFEVTLTKYTETESLALPSGYEISNDFQVIVPHPTDRPHIFPSNCIKFFHGQLLGRLCFPILDFFQGVATYFEISLGLFSPFVWSAHRVSPLPTSFKPLHFPLFLLSSMG